MWISFILLMFGSTLILESEQTEPTTHDSVTTRVCLGLGLAFICSAVASMLDIDQNAGCAQPCVRGRAQRCEVIASRCCCRGDSGLAGILNRALEGGIPSLRFGLASLGFCQLPCSDLESWSINKDHI